VCLFDSVGVVFFGGEKPARTRIDSVSTPSAKQGVAVYTWSFCGYQCITLTTDRQRRCKISSTITDGYDYL